MIWLLITQLTLANEHTYPIVLTGGIGKGTASDGTLGTGLLGHAIFQFNSVALDLGYQEFYYPSFQYQEFSSFHNLNGGIFLGARHWILPNGLFIREGLFHQHETPLDVLQDRPISSILGAADGINHRTGLELACGILQTQPPSWLPLMGGVDVNGQYFWDNEQPSWYLNVDITLGLYMGEKASVIQIR